MNSRRRFISKIAQASAFTLLPLYTRNIFAAVPLSRDTIFDALEIMKLTGAYKSRPRFNRQPQVKAIDGYPDHRLRSYSNYPNAKETTAGMSDHEISNCW